MLTDLEISAMRSTSTMALPDTGTITRPADPTDGSLDPATGVHTPAAATVVYTGAMRVRPADSSESTGEFGDLDLTTQRYVMTLPHDTAPPAVGDRVAVTVSSAPDIGDAEFQVVAVSHGSWRIDRRCVLETIT